MAANHTQKDWMRMGVRIPQDLHEQVHQTARAEGRSYNAQLLTFVREGIQTRAQQPQGAQQ